ncbi:Aldo/keto reductase [Cytidiella melzeri]|nr:Aldo/keto reductase [Cytidiella melzeri]
MVVSLTSPQPVHDLPPLPDIPDTDEDCPISGVIPGETGSMRLPELIFGAAAFSNQYNASEHLSSTIPLRTVRLALRYGLKAFDTSAYYGPSEIVLGTALKTLAPEFPRESYKLLTKCGRYGVKPQDFDYSPATIRKSVQRSLARLNTTYLDAVYLHDVEFVCTSVQPRSAGHHESALTTDAKEYGIAVGKEAKVWGDGDRVILDAIAELRKMKQEGIIKNIGFSGYPLPVLLRLSLLVLHTEPYEPIDVLMSYSHLNLQNSSFATFLPYFRDRAKISQLITASPLNMGLLTPSPPPWHPAPHAIMSAIREASAICDANDCEGGLVNLALGYAYREARKLELPTVVGLSKLSEVHQTMRAWRELKSASDDPDSVRRKSEERVLEHLKEFKDYSWSSP